MNHEGKPAGANGGRPESETKADANSIPPGGMPDERRAYITALKDAAHSQRQQGISTIPVNGKDPLVKWKPLQSQVPTKEEISDWPWHKATGIGLVVAETLYDAWNLSGVFVLDIETQHREAAEAWLDEHDPGWRTGRVAQSGGGGLHVYYQNDAPVRKGTCAFGDVQGDRTIVIIPPSIHQRTQQPYQWLSKGPLRKVDPAIIPGYAAKKDAPTTEHESSGPIPEGERNTALTSIAGKLWNNRIDAETLEATLQAINLRRCQPPLPTEEVTTIVASVCRYEQPPKIVVGGKKADDHGETSSHGASPGVTTDTTEDFLPDVPPFPVEVLPSTLRSFVSQGAAAMDCPPDFFAVPLLALVAGGIGNQLTIRVTKLFKERPILWTAIIGEPGTAKSPAMKITREPFTNEQAIAMEVFRERLREYEFQQKRAKDRKRGEPLVPVGDRPELSHWYSTDCTLESVDRMLGHNQSITPGFTIVRDELVSWIQGFDAYANKGEKQVWMQMWSGESSKSDRAGRDTYYVPDPTVSFVGGIQPDMLGHLNRAAKGRDGFMERFLCAWPDTHPMDLTDLEISDDVLEGTNHIIHRLRTDQFRGEVRLSPEAAARFKVWHQDNNLIQQQVHGLAKGFAAKAPRQVARLCLILHALEVLDLKQLFPQLQRNSNIDKSNPTAVEVSEKTMGNAIRLIEYFRAHANRLYSQFGHSALHCDPLATRILSILEDRGGSATTYEIYHALGRKERTEERHAALQRVVDAGLVIREEVPPTSRGGRRTERWHLQEKSSVVSVVTQDEAPHDDATPHSSADQADGRETKPIPPATPDDLIDRIRATDPPERIGWLLEPEAYVPIYFSLPEDGTDRHYHDLADALALDRTIVLGALADLRGLGLTDQRVLSQGTVQGTAMRRFDPWQWHRIVNKNGASL